MAHLKIQLELNVVGDKKFLDFWDVIGGDDVNAEMVGDKLITNDSARKEITLQEFSKKVIKAVEKW